MTPSPLRPARRLAGVLAALFACVLAAAPAAAQEPWRDPARPLDARVDDLLGRLTLEEKLGLLRFESPGVARLGIPSYNWWNEALHGVARAGRATVFPQAINLAATFDTALVYRVASAISTEARAKYNAAQRIGNRAQYAGLTFWSPNINLFRDLRWGRGHETYGEDPYLTARTGVAFVRGLQGDHPRYLKAAAAAKHLAVHSGPEATRQAFDAVASPKDLREAYLPAFEALVREADVEGVMCSYNRINGVPACAHPALLTDTLRGAWGFDGYVVSDCGALGNIFEHHKVTATAEEAAALALRAGVDVECGELWEKALGPAVAQGLAAEADVDRAAGYALRTLFRLGLFDPPEANPWAGLGPEVVGSAAHAALAREAAQRSLVLLKNDGVLPLRRDLPALALVGPNAASTDVLLGNYNGLNDGLTTFVEGIAAAVGAGTILEHHLGVQIDRGNAGGWVVYRSHTADAIVAFVGLSPMVEGEQGETDFIAEGHSLELPPHQVALIRALRKGYDRPLVVVVTGGSPRAIGEVHELADAVIWAGYPGQAGGYALADVLFGDAAPSGRLPVTVPASSDAVPPYEDYTMVGRGYRYQGAEPLYPFGFGLSYTTFAYRGVRVAPSVAPGEAVTATVTVANTGGRAAEEVVQLYLRDEAATVRVPRSTLAAFRRVALAPGEVREVAFTLRPEQLRVVGEDGAARYEPGWYTLYAGGASPGPRAEALGAPAPAAARFELKQAHR